jgi:hypothetical protein
MMADVIAERTFDRRDDAGQVTVRVYAPKKDDDWEGWSATIEILGLPEEFRQDVSGIDSFQALYLALSRACTRLEKADSMLKFRENADASLPLILPWNEGLALKCEVREFAQAKILTHLRSLPSASSETP